MIEVKGGPLADEPRSRWELGAQGGLGADKTYERAEAGAEATDKNKGYSNTSLAKVPGRK